MRTTVILPARDKSTISGRTATTAVALSRPFVPRWGVPRFADSAVDVSAFGRAAVSASLIGFAQLTPAIRLGETAPMRLVVVGANGGTGTAVVDRALAEGHQVVAAVRRPNSVPARDRLMIEQCDVLDPLAVASVISQSDAVISTIGPANNRKPGTLISTGVANMLTGCVTGGINRFVFESGLMVSDGRELSMAGRAAIKIVGLLLSGLQTDKMRAEAAIVASALEWVIVRPPNLTRSSASSDCISAPAARINPAKAISHADCATTLIKAAVEPHWVRQVVNIGRP